MDIFNRPPAISDDTLQYALYPPREHAEKAFVTSFAACIGSLVEKLLPDFLWHRDAFELKVVPDPDVKDGWILEGRMRVGDCVDDEWCVVWLLKEISAKWDLAISVYDSDGEFLLIEAAEALPKWVTPSNSENRVWLYGSRLHLIPLSHASPPSRKRRRRAALRTHDSDDEGGADDNEDEFISVVDALKVVRDTNMDTFAPLEVEKLVWQRISGYPAAAKSHVHVTKAWLPVDIARALSVNPSLVQKPVETFYTRDAIQLRAAHRMSRFPPEPSVLTTVKMTRTAYAQLVGQKFYPPKTFGRWTEKEGTKEWRWRDVGMKLACGFEMLYQENKGRSDALAKTAEGIHSSAEANKIALRRTPDYNKYIENLKSAGYFRGESEGSALWNELENKAVETFIQVRREDDVTRPSFASLFDTAVSQAPDKPVPIQAEEDPEGWLNIDAENFDQMLERTMGGSQPKKEADENAMDVDQERENTTAEDRLANEQAAKLRRLASKVEEFVEGQGDLEGARFADEESSDDDEFSEGMPSTDSDDEDNAAEINDSNDNDNREDATARQAAMDNLVPGIDPSEYGKMPPSFHSNSQRVAPTTIETDVVEDARSQVKPDGKDEKRNVSGGKPSEFPASKPIRQPLLQRDEYDGVEDSDDEGDEDEEDEEDQPQLVGDVEVDMGEEEEEFLEFARQALGIGDEQWGEMIKERQDRGAFVPASAKKADSAKLANTGTTKPNTMFSAMVEEPLLRPPVPGPRPKVNPNLDSFEAVMQAMDEELSRSRNRPLAQQTDQGHAANKGKGKERAEAPTEEGDMEDVEEEIEDIEKAMEAELRAALERGDDGDMDGEGEGSLDYNLIKNFLESFKSQAGLSGPVGNLAGRLEHGWLPRDET